MTDRNRQGKFSLQLETNTKFDINRLSECEEEVAYTICGFTKLVTQLLHISDHIVTIHLFSSLWKHQYVIQSGFIPKSIQFKIISLVYIVPRHQMEQMISAHEACYILNLQGNFPVQGDY